MRLGLGTAQFGMDYGVSNPGGKTPRAEVGRILACALREGVDLLDTAALYGDSEAAIGAWPEEAARFRIVTKTPTFVAKRIGPADASALRLTFEQSLARLRRDKLYGLLVHAPADLLKPGGELLWAEMAALQNAGLVECIGYSTYTGAELDALLARYRPGLVQVPVNALDQRLLRDGRLAQLKHLGVEVHARSIFLQGLLLMAPERLPAHLAVFRGELAAYAAFLDLHGLSRLQGALRFIRGVEPLDAALVGVNDEVQLRECLAAFRGEAATTIDFGAAACNREELLNPAAWPANATQRGDAACAS